MKRSLHLTFCLALFLLPTVLAAEPSAPNLLDLAAVTTPAPALCQDGASAPAPNLGLPKPTLASCQSECFAQLQYCKAHCIPQPACRETCYDLLTDCQCIQCGIC